MLSVNQLAGFGGNKYGYFYDSFERSQTDLEPYWSIINGSIDLTSNSLRVTTISQFAIAMYRQKAPTANQYIRVRVPAGLTTEFPLWLFRYSDSASRFYLLYYIGNSLSGDYRKFEWQTRSSAAGTNTGITGAKTAAIPLTENSILGFTLTGTGVSTKLRGFLNPVRLLPLAADHWDEGDTPLFEFTYAAGGGLAVDTGIGTNVGIGGYNNNVVNAIRQDDFRGGSF